MIHDIELIVSIILIIVGIALNLVAYWLRELIRIERNRKK